MRNVSLVGSLVLLAVAACGPDNGPGFYAQGSLQASVSDPTNGSSTTGFRFDQQVRIDPTLPTGATNGPTGTCQIGPGGRTVHLTAVGAGASDLRDLTLTLNAWDQDTCTNCQHGQIQAQIGQSTFTGVETRGGTAASQCTFQADRRGSFGMIVTTHCTGLTATGDARTVGIDGSLTLDGCDGPNSNSP